MKPETVRKKWIAALRSGKYRQTKWQLRNKKGFCCLGVLCELAVKNEIIKKYDGNESALPLAVKKWAGLKSVEGEYSTSNLIDRNDHNGWSFKKIAWLIKKEPKGLFV